jgi:hypothetical protein
MHEAHGSIRARLQAVARALRQSAVAHPCAFVTEEPDRPAWWLAHQEFRR